MEAGCPGQGRDVHLQADTRVSGMSGMSRMGQPVVNVLSDGPYTHNDSTASEACWMQWTQHTATRPQGTGRIGQVLLEQKYKSPLFFGFKQEHTLAP